MNKKDLEMREQAREAIIEALEDGYSGYYWDLHDEVFNTDYYTIWTDEAKRTRGIWFMGRYRESTDIRKR